MMQEDLRKGRVVFMDLCFVSLCCADLHCVSFQSAERDLRLTSGHIEKNIILIHKNLLLFKKIQAENVDTGYI